MYDGGITQTSAPPRAVRAEWAERMNHDAPGPAPIAHNGRAEIAALLEQQDKATVALHEAIAQLEDKLRPVLMPVPPDAPGNPVAAQPIGSQIGGYINSNTERIVSAIARLQRLTSDLAI